VDAIGAWLGEALPSLRLVDWPAACLSIVPGLGHLRRKQQRLGCGLMAGWVIALVAGVLTLGTGRGALFYATMMLVHAVAMGLFLRPALAGKGRMAGVFWGLLFFLALQFALYRPAGAGVQQLCQWSRVEHLRANPLIENGDVLIYTGPASRPEFFRRGDLVIYHVDAHGVAGYGGRGFVQRGFSVDRIIAVPGDVVELTAGRMTVNGELVSADQGPVGGVGPLPDAKFTVAADTYFIVPSLLNVMTAGQLQHHVGGLLRQSSDVPADSIIGKVWWRVNPVSRFGRLE